MGHEFGWDLDDGEAESGRAAGREVVSELG